MNKIQVSTVSKNLWNRVRRLIISSIILASFSGTMIAQLPTWVPTTPSTGTTGPTSIPVNYGIDMTGTVYIAVFNYNYGGTLTSTGVRNIAISGPAGALVATAVIPVTSINTILQYIVTGLASSTLHSVYLVAANSIGQLQASPIKLIATTQPCPKIQLFNFFGNLGECVNLGAQGMFQVAPLGVLPTGILAGSTWTIDWGDGTPVWTYTSASDNDLPPAQIHNFATTTDCAYVGLWTVKNPCNEFYAAQGVFVVHGRDIPTDGDGLLQMQETTTGDVDIVYVCEGSEHNLVLQDISTWNCQNPNVPAPLNPNDYDNESPRTIQFVYGETPAGAVMNTITGNVLIGGSNVANASNGYVGNVIGPLSPPNPNTLTDVITIPATCQAGERFYVYIKDWNKCNPYVDENLDYVYEQFIIEVIDAPPAPAVVSPQEYCYGSVPTTLTATISLAGNTLNWYDDAALTNLLFTGNPYTHGITAAGTYDFYVTETSGVNGCEGPPSRIDLIIREELSRPGPISGPSEVCINATGQVFSVSANPPTMPVGGTTEYVWTVPGGWTITSGQGTRQITVDIGGSAGSRTVSVVNQYTTAPQCTSPARSYGVTVSPLSVGGTVSGTPEICLGSSVTLSLSGQTGSVLRWQRRLLPTATWTNVSNTSTTYTYTPGSVGTWEFRAQVQSGSCSSDYSSVYSVVVDPTSVGGTISGGNTPICLGSSTGTMTLSGYVGTIVRWQYRRNSGTWNNISNTTTTLNHTPSQSGTYDYRVQVRSGVCSSAYSSLQTIVVNPLSVGGSVTGGTTPLCIGSSTGTMTLGSYTGSVVRWQRRLNAGAWVTIANTNDTYSEVPASAGTWEYRAEVQSGVCTSDYSSPRAIVVVPLSVGGTVSGGTTPLCPGDNTGVMTLSGHTGSIVRWEKRVDGGSWTNIANTGATYSEVPSSSGTWDYRAYVQNSPCSGDYSSVRTLIVRPAYNAQLHDDISICNNASTNFNVVLSAGTPPYIINYTRNGTPQTQITNYSSGANISTGVLTTGSYQYQITSVTDNNGCYAQSLGTPITVTVGAALVNATISGSGNDCDGATSWFSLHVNGGAPPYQVTYTLDGGANAVVSNYNNDDHIGLGALSVNSHTVHIVSIRDACLDLVPSLPANYTFTIYPIPNAGATVNNTPELCNGGTTDIVLQSTVPSTNFTWTVANVPAVTWTNAPSGGTISNGNGISIAQLLQHTASFPTNVTYTITPYGPLPTSCPGSAITRTVTVNPRGQVNDPADQSLCAGAATAAVIFTTNRTGGTTTYSWTNSNTSIGLAASSGTGNIPSFTAVNAGTSPASTTIVVTPYFEGCAGTTQSFTITVNPAGQVNDPADQLRCAGAATAAVNFTTNRTGGTTTYAWSNSNTSIGLGANGTGNIPSFTPLNSGTAPVTATITVTPSFEGCVGASETFTITVNPSGQVNDPADQTLCNGAATTAVNFSTNRTGGTTSYAWSNNTTSIGLAASGTGNIASFTATNNGSVPVTATITVTPSFEGCAGTPQTFTITVNPSGQVNDPADQVVCNGSTTTAVGFTTNRTGGTTTYSWSNNNTSIGLGAASTGNIASFTAINNGTAPVTATITVTPSFEGCAGTPQTFTITVNPSGQVDDPSDQTVCNGSATTTVNFNTNRTGGSTLYSWTNSNTTIGLAGSGTGNIASFTATNSGTIPVTSTITVTPSFEGCAGTSQSFTITVNPTPMLSGSLTPPDLCSNSLFTYLPTSLTPGTTFSWTRLASAGITPAGPVTGTNGVSETLRNLTHSTIAVTYEYVLTANGCSNTQNVIVNIKPEPVISDQSVPVCSGETLIHHILLENFTNPGDNVTFTWPAPVLSGGLTGGTARTVPSSADMTDVFNNTSGGAETATYTVTPVYNGCVGDPRDIIVTVGSQPVLGNLDMFACSDVPTGLVLAVAPTSSPATTYDIDLITVQAGLVAAGGNAVAATGIVDPNYLANDIFTNQTGVNRTVTYHVRPVYGATCIGDWVNVVVTVRPEPVIVPGQTQTVCSNTPVSREILLVPVNTPAGTTFSWPMPLMSDGSTQGAAVSGLAADPAGTIHITDTFENYGAAPITATYSVTPTSFFGCDGNPVSVVITVNPEPSAPVITGDDMLCTGQTNVIYTVPLHPGSSYLWTVPASVGTKTFDANSNAIIITAAASAGSGTITVVETNSYGCSGLAGTIDVDVMAPSSQSNITGDNIVCALETGLYSVPAHAGSVYTWHLPTGAALIGDPSSASITVTFGTVSGSISVTEVNAAGCITVHNPLSVTVRPLPTAIISNSGTVCAENTQPVNITLTGTAPWTVVYAINGTDQPALNIATSPYTLNASLSGNYTVTSVTDNNGCTNTGIGNATVNHYPVPTATISGTAEVCSGGSAVITISLTGTAPYDFIYTDGVTPVTVTNHPSSVYNATVTPVASATYTITSMNDDHGCLGTLLGSAVITINPKPVLTLTGTNLSCYNDNSGAIDLTINAGTGTAPFSYSWTGPGGFTAGTEDISGLQAGYYAVTVTDSKGCTASGNITLTQPPVLTLSKSGDIVLLCNGYSNGTGSFTAAGGTAPYIFTELVNTSGATLVMNPASVTVTNAAAGTITVRATDAHGCTAESTITVTQPPALGISAVTTNILCFGGNNGTIITTVTGGVAPYIYTWTASGGGSGLTAGASNQSGLTAGTYDLTVTDANGCTANGSWTLTQPTALAVTVTTDDNLIGTCSSAQLDAVVTGGVMPAGGYIYSWSPAAGLSATNIADPVATPASTTTYTVTVTDANGCIKTGSVTINVAPVLTAVAFADDNLIGTCPSSEAQLDVNVSGGEAPYSYNWTPVGGLSATNIKNPLAKPAATTTYSVTVTDANGCVANANVTITVAPDLDVTATVDDNLIGTCPTSVAHLSATATGGEGAYTYLWDNAGTLDDATKANPTAKPAVNTTYTVTVTDANGCTDQASVTVNVAPDLAVTATADDMFIGTCPSSVSHLDATVTGGEAAYTYKWTPTAGLDDSNSKTPTARPSVTTTYTVTVTDANGCTATASVTVVVAPALTVTASADDYNIGICPSSEAQLTAVAAGGEPGYTYLWSPSAGLSATDIANPVAKPAVTTTYTVLVTDVNGCTATTTVTITIAQALAATASASDPNIGTCLTSVSNLNVIVTGGETPYLSYSWSPVAGLSDPLIQNPVAKPAVTTTYTVTVTDNNGCTATAPVTVTVLPDLVATASADDLFIGTCPVSRSNLDVTVTGGEAGYTYSWLPVTGLNNPNVSNPVARPSVTTTYTVTVTDVNGCQATDDITITVQPVLTVSAVADDNIISTCPTSVANLTATATGGEELAGGGYIWSWAPSAGLSATDIPNPIAKPSSTTTYTVTVTDNNGCTATNTVTIEVRPPLAAIATASDYLIGACPGQSSTLDVTVTGGEMPYSYNWVPAASLSDPAVKSPVAAPSANTTYTVTVTDANGCMVTADVTINIAPPLTATAAVDDDPIGACPSSVAHLSTTVSGGEGGYTYLWDNAATLNNAAIANPTAKPAASTLYTVLVTDSNGCTTTAQVQVNVAPPLTVTASADDYIIGACPSSVAHLTAVGSGGELLLSGDYTYNWSPAAGLNYTNVASPTARPAATTTYTVVITDRNGCTASDNVTITVNPPIVLTTTPVVYNGGYNITCNGASDGAIDLGVTGGEAPYTYAWTGPAGFTATTEDISGLLAGTYNVTVTDANNCISVTSAVLLQPAVLTLGKTPDVVLSCYGDATATGSFTVSGGTAPYTLSVVSDDTGASVTITGTSLAFTGAAAGTITAGVIDDNGCYAQASIIITQPNELLPGTINGTQEVCYLGNPGALNEVSPPSGGPAVILFQWERSLDAGLSWGNVPGATIASYDPPAGILQTTYFRRRVNSGTCDPAYSDTVIVTVNPLPVASISGTDFVCPGDAATLTVTVTVGESPYTVVLSDGTTIAGYTSGSPITVNPTAPTTYTITSVTDNKGCTVSAPHADLTGSATIDVKVVPEIALQPLNVTACEDDVAVFTTDAGMTTNAHYQWYVDSGSGMTLMPGETAATLSVTAATAIDGYSYQAEISGDCPVPVVSDIVTLTINEKPEIAVPPADVTLCSGEDAIFTVDAGVTTNPMYQWYVNSGSGWTQAVGARYQGTTTATLTVVSTLEIMSGYRYLVRVSGACAPYIESVPVTLTVTRQAEITQHPVSLTLCEGQPATFTVNAGLTTNPAYEWEISTDGGMSWTLIPGETASSYTIAAVATADNNTAYRAIVSSSCGSNITSLPAYLTVRELPEIVDQPDDVTICEHTIADFFVDAGVTTGATYRWQRSIDSGTTWNNLTETATYFGVTTMNLKVNGTTRFMSGDMFRVIVSGTCTPPDTSDAALLTVNTAPEILAQPVASSICENTNTSFTVSAQGTAINYQWFVDITGTGTSFTAITDGGVYSGATTNTLVLTTVPRGYDNYRYRVEVEGTCPPRAISNTVQLDVAIETIINTQPADTAICEFMTASFTALADGASLTYQWQVFNGSAWIDLTNTGIYLGVQTPTLMLFGPSRTMDGTRYRVIIRGTCSADMASDEAVLTVHTAPELSDHPDEFRGCPGGNATFSVVAAGTNLTYQWQVNSGSGFVNVTNDGTYSGTDTPDLLISNLTLSMNGHLVRVVVSGTCLPPVTSSFAPLRVYMEPSIISEPADAGVCEHAGTAYYAQVFNTGAGETTVWQVNEGSGWNSLADGVLYQGTQTPQLVLMNTTVAMNGWHYRLEITGPCGLYYTRAALLTVNPPPTAQIEPVDTLLVCGGVPTQLHGHPAGGSLIYSVHRWFGDVGPLSQYNIENPVFNTSMAGYYRLIYQVTDSKGCIGLDTLVIQVEKPVAMFTLDAPSGCQPLTVNFINGSSGYTSLLWQFGDGDTSTDINTSHTYANPGPALAYYTASLEVTSANGCISTMENNITVYPEILSDFSMSDDTICSGESVMFSTLPGAFRYYWNYGDGQSEYGSNVINHIYVNATISPVTYDVTLTTESFFGCTSTTTMPLVVYPTPVPAFTATPASQTFPSATVSFTNGTNPGTWTWLWDFGDSNSSTDESTVHTYAAPGEFAVSLTVSNGVCTEQVVHNVSVLPAPPIAEFDSIPSGCAPWTISVNNTSLYGTSYHWDFGDGYTSQAMNPTYTYVQAGTYQITLTVTGPGGTDVRSRIVHVYPSPRAYFEVSPVKVYVNDEQVRLYNLTEGGDTFIWEFGDGDTSHLRDPFHKYTTEGLYDITLHAYSSNGCYDSYTLSPAVTVEPFGELIFASVFKPNAEGPIEIDELPTSGESMDQFFFPPVRETVLEYHLQIFNRWGTLIFETYDINRPWNGYYKGKLCAQGVYVWLVEGKYANGRPYKKAGDITLLH